ncbi:MAG: glycosyltransferase [Actinomycetes bacterium]
MRSLIQLNRRRSRHEWWEVWMDCARALSCAGRRIGNARGARARRAGHRVLVMTPATRFGSWSWIEDIIQAAPATTEWIIVSYGRPSRELVGVRFVCLPEMNYSRIGHLLSDRRLAALNIVYLFPLSLISLILTITMAPDVLVGNGIASTLLLAPAKMLGRRELRVAYHGYTGFLGQRSRRWLRRVLVVCDGAVVNSSGSHADLALVIPEERITTVEHWADGDFFRRRVRVESEAGTLRILFVGRLDTEKFQQCLQVVKGMWPREGLELVVAGTGSLESEVRGLNGAKVLGYVWERGKLAELFAWADVTWAPADITYLSRPGVEALASGCPIIVSDIPAVEQRPKGERIPKTLIPKGVGWVVDGVSDEEAVQLVGSLRDGGVPSGMRQMCREYAWRHYSPYNARRAASLLLEGR